MLRLCRCSASVLYKPCLKPAIECTSTRRLAAAVGHDPTYHHSFNVILIQDRFEILLGVVAQESVVGIFRYDGKVVLHPFRDLGDEFPVFGALSDGAGGTPFANKLVARFTGKLFFGVAVLGEDYG